MNNEKGLIHIYCGEGKGKTTAALGLALRAAGAGKRVHLVQLLKGNPTSELNSLELLPGITVDRPEKAFGFTFNMTEEQKSELTGIHNRLLISAFEKMNCGDTDMLIIDEFFAAYNKGLLDRQIADRIVFEKASSCELVLTGRGPDRKFIDTADYVSEIKCVMHPYEQGVSARKGIEY
ncbi:MAG: cob(I)yrinic acid a,c-diamide adenosyltransferase [Huintestinicola sp.]|uniref:cob(I)yrinic acid a,c-diamide adenosyltransferase n=1 Tax=Huintestinicola sp. TaxID=2981661 RepID=UPI003F00B7A1